MVSFLVLKFSKKLEVKQDVHDLRPCLDLTNAPLARPLLHTVLRAVQHNKFYIVPIDFNVCANTLKSIGTDERERRASSARSAHSPDLDTP